MVFALVAAFFAAGFVGFSALAGFAETGFAEAGFSDAGAFFEAGAFSLGARRRTVRVLGRSRGGANGRNA